MSRYFIVGLSTLLVSLSGCSGHSEEGPDIDRTKAQKATSSEETGEGGAATITISYPDTTCGDEWKYFHETAGSLSSSNYLDAREDFRNCDDELVVPIQDEYDDTDPSFRGRRYNLVHELGTLGHSEGITKLVDIAKKDLGDPEREEHIARSSWGHELRIRSAAIGGIETIGRVSGVSVVDPLEHIFLNAADRPVQSITADALLAREGYTEDDLLQLADEAGEPWVEDVLNRDPIDPPELTDSGDTEDETDPDNPPPSWE